MAFEPRSVYELEEPPRRGERATLIAEFTAYLAQGGLWNSEQARHDRMRDLLMRCRDVLI